MGFRNGKRLDTPSANHYVVTAGGPAAPETAPEEPKKKRGRPRKNPLPEAETQPVDPLAGGDEDFTESDL